MMTIETLIRAKTAAAFLESPMAFERDLFKCERIRVNANFVQAAEKTVEAANAAAKEHRTVVSRETSIAAADQPAIQVNAANDAIVCHRELMPLARQQQRAARDAE